MDRRNFLRAIALTGAAITTIKEAEAMSMLTQSFETTQAASKYDLVAVMGGEPEAMFRKAIAEMGGMKTFISKGDKVCVKPNIGWDQPVEMAANTNPKLVAEIIKQCFDAGASEVTVFDHTCDDWRKTYSNSGIEEAAKKAGAKVMPAHQESYYKSVSIPKGKSLKSAKIHQAIVDSESDNDPILKNHGGAQLTISMKNYMESCGIEAFPCQRPATMYRRRVYIRQAPCAECGGCLPADENQRPQRKSPQMWSVESLFLSQDIIAAGYRCSQLLQSGTRDAA